MPSPLTEVLETRPRDRSTIIEAPNNQVETIFFDRPFPLEDRTTQDDHHLPLPPKFAELPHFMLRELPSAGPLRKAKSRTDLYEAQKCAVNCSKVLHDEHGRFVQEIVRTNLDRVGLRLDDPGTNERLRAKLAGYSQKLPDFTFRWPRSLSLELHGKSDFVVRTELEQGVYESLETMTQKLVQSLEIINSLGLVSLLEWVYEDAYRTHAYQSEVVRGSPMRNGKPTKEAETAP